MKRALAGQDEVRAGRGDCVDLDIKNVGTKTHTLPAILFNCDLSINGSVCRFMGCSTQGQPIEFAGNSYTPFVRVNPDRNGNSSWPSQMSRCVSGLGNKLQARFPLIDMVTTNSNEVEIEAVAPQPIRP